MTRWRIKGNSTRKDKSEQWGKRIRTSIDSGSVIEIDKEGSRKEGESMEIIDIRGIKSGGGGGLVM